jgi:hypothetical protein
MAKNESMGKGNFANMPTEHKQTEYKKNSYVTDANLDDTITGIDQTIGKEVSRARGHVSNQK